MKRIICCALILVLALTTAACGASAPDLGEVKDELKSLIEASYEINEIFFGEGLETYARGGEYDKEHLLYSENDEEFAYYEYVITDAGYYYTDHVKWAAEKVYTAEYLAGVYTMAFDGYADENTGKVTTARYLDANGWLMRYAFGENDPFDQLDGKKRRYDFDSMEIVKPYSAGYVNLSSDSDLEGNESDVLTITLHFKKTADGWRLDSPTY